MAAVGKITLDASQYIQQMNQVQSITVNATSTMEEGAKKYGTAINKAGIATRFVSAEMGQSVVALGRAFQVFAGGKIAIVVAALAAAITGLKKAWDALTVSAKENELYLQKKTEADQRDLDAMRKKQSEEDAMLERLAELSKQQNKTKEEELEAITLAEKLAKKYGTLGTEVNNLTGDYESLSAEMKKINDEQNKQKISSLEDITKNQGKLIEEKFREGITPGFWGSVWDMFSFGSKKSVDMQADDFRSMSPQQQKAFVKARLEDSKTSEKDIQFWSELETLIDAQIAKQEELNSLRKTGADSSADQNKELEKASKASREQKDAEAAADAAAVEELEKERALQEEIDRKHGEALARELEQEEAIKKARLEAAQDRRFGLVSGLKFDAMRAVGLGDQAAIQEAIYNETMAQGHELDPRTIAQLTQITKARLRLNDLMATSTAPMDYAPRVNSLIARGGSAQAVKLPSLEDIQKRTLNQLQDITKLVRYINDHVDGWGKVTNA